MVRVFLLHGGIFSFDGIVTSAGMNTLVNMLRKIQYVTVETYLWAHWSQVYLDVVSRSETNKKDKIVLVGYSGGGMKATWVANGCIMLGGGRISYKKPPHIDLLIAYDPSPAGSIQKLGNNVIKAVCYHNTHPLMFGVGGGSLEGPNVDTIQISEQHLMVQWDKKLHYRTVTEVENLL